MNAVCPRRALGFAALFILVACQSEQPRLPPTGTTELRLIVIATQPSGAVSGVSLVTQPVVEVRGANQALVTTPVTVTVSVASGTGTLGGGTSATTVNGIARFSGLRVNGVGPHALQFSGPGLTPATSNPLTVSQTEAALAIQSPPGGATTGQPLSAQPTVRVNDNAGLLVATSTAAVTASIASGTGTLSGTTTVAATAGLAQFTDLVIDGTGPHTLRFTSGVLASVTTPPVTIDAAPGVPVQLAVTAQPSGAVTDVAFTVQPTVEIRDGLNARVNGATGAVTASIASGSGTLSGTTTVSAANGIATFTDLSISGIGAHTLTFTASGLAPATSSAFTVVAAPGAPVQLVAIAHPGTSSSGGLLSPQPVVQVRDGANNVVSSAALPVTASIASGSGVLSGTTTVTSSNGVATFTDLVITGSGSHTLAYASPGLVSAASPPFTVIGPPAQLALTTHPSGAASGTPLSSQPVVQVRDASNNLVASSAAMVTASISSGSGALSGTTTITAVGGVATFTDLVITGTGPHALQFASAGIQGVISSLFNVSAAPTQLGIAVQPSANAVGGVPFSQQPVINLRDAGNNSVLLAGVPVTAAIATGGGTLGGTLTVATNSNGVAAFPNLSITGADGARTLTFSAPNLTSATSNPINVTAAAPLIAGASFDSYTSTAELLGDCTTFHCPEDRGTSGITLDATMAPPGGTQSMRYSYLHGGTGCTSISVGRTIRFPTAQQEVWAEFPVRWSTNFTTANAACPPNDHKLIFGDTESNASGQWAFSVGAGAPPAHSLTVERPAPDTRGPVFPNRPGVPTAEALWQSDSWHTVRLHIKHSTTPTSTNGIFEVWIDGVLLHRETLFNTDRNDGSGSPDFITGFSFAHNKDDGPPGVEMYLWWGNIKVYNVNPGW
jgi:hypothetical protein